MKKKGDQLDMLDGYEAPPPVHRNGPDTEKLAADKVAPVVKKIREAVRDLALERGVRGVTAWEAIVSLGMQEHEYSVRPRLTELCKDKFGAILTATEARRPNRHDNSEQVYVASVYLQVAAPGWTIRNYNTFLREAREEYDLSLPEARLLYREVRDWKVGPAYGADVDRYKDALYDDPGLVVESMLYGAPDVIGPVYEAADYPDDYELGEGAEIEMTAETYSEDAPT